MPSIVLIGDSVLDNQAYTGAEPDVAGHLRGLLPPDWTVTLCAVDGTTTSDVASQFGKVPSSATHVVLSLGGNDAMDNADLLEMPVDSTGVALEIFGQRVAAFEDAYCRALDKVVGLCASTTVCTIYNADLSPAEATRARIALMLFNDVILRRAFMRGLPVVDLRMVCSQPSDFTKQIEPSAAGGLKIARAIVKSLALDGVVGRRSVVTAG